MRFRLIFHTPYFISHAQETYSEMTITETHTAGIEVNVRRMKPEPFGDIWNHLKPAKIIQLASIKKTCDSC
jgi:hypothetical protein